jgi:hypothetical protein
MLTFTGNHSQGFSGGNFLRFWSQVHGGMMRLIEQITGIKHDLSELKEETSLGEKELVSLLKQFLRGNDMQAPELSDEHIDTLYRLAWWVTLTSELIEQSSLGSGNPENPLTHLLETLEKYCRETEEERDIERIGDVAEQLASLEGQQLRNAVVSKTGSREADPSEEMLIQLHNYLPVLTSHVEKTIELLRVDHQQNLESRLDELVEGLEGVIDARESLDQYLKRHGINADSSELKANMTDLLDAIDRTDSIRTGDLLKHEINPRLERFHKQISFMLGEMDSALDSNLACLREDDVRNILNVSLPSLTAVTIGEAEDGAHSLVVSSDVGDYTFVSRYQPQEEAERWARHRIEEEVPTSIIIHGFGLGYRIRALLDELSPETHIFIDEPSPVLARAVFRTLDCTAILEDPRVELFVGDESKLLESRLSDWAGWNSPDELQIIGLPNYHSLFADSRQRLNELAEMQAGTVQLQRSTNFSQCVQWIKNTVRNLVFSPNFRFVDVLEDQFEGKPAVLISGGPSLDKNIELLKGTEHKVLIIAIDTVIPVLEEHGIEPDLMVTADGLKSNYELNLAGSEYQKIPMVAALISFPRILEEHDAPKFILTSEIEAEVMLRDLFDRLGIEPEGLNSFTKGLTVSHIAYHVADILGASPIILIGQDLAYDETGREYASGVQREKGVEETLTVEGVDGEVVETKLEWYSFLVEFQKMIGQDDFVIDATEGGAKIAGTQVSTLADALHEYGGESVELGPVLNQLQRSTETVVPSNKEREILSDWGATLLDDMMEVEGALSRGSALCEALAGASAETNESADELLAGLEDVEREIENSESAALLARVIRELQYLSEEQRQKASDPGDKQAKLRRTVEFMHRRYEKIGEVIDGIRPILRKLERTMGQ